jgi:putative FmdB family regulatory protein
MVTLGFVPTYEYECPKCPRVFDVRQRISEPALTTCEVCGGPIHRLLAAAPFILKGGGWYVTDYPSESRKKALSSESSSTSEKASASSEKASTSEKEKASTSSESKSTGGDGSSSSSTGASGSSKDTSKSKSKDTSAKSSSTKASSSD